jgi:hypothetical protein
LREILEAYLKGVMHGLQDGVMVMKAIHAEVVAKSEHRRVCQFEQVLFERVL